MLHGICYLLCGLTVGALNAVAGGGSFILFPVLMFVGLTPILANTTMSMVVLPGTASSVVGYRSQIAKLKPIYFWLLVPCALGSLVGAAILVSAPGSSFERLVPIFMAMASMLLIFQPMLNGAIYRKRILKKHHVVAVVLVAVAFLALSAYGGYFGAGFGIIVLAILGLTPIRDIQQMNGLKNLAGLGVGIVDCTYYVAHNLIDWKILPLFLVGNLLGGYFAAVYGRKLPANKLRLAMVAVGVGVTIYTFRKFYL